VVIDRSTRPEPTVQPPAIGPSAHVPQVRAVRQAPAAPDFAPPQIVRLAVTRLAVLPAALKTVQPGERTAQAANHSVLAPMGHRSDVRSLSALATGLRAKIVPANFALARKDPSMAPRRSLQEPGRPDPGAQSPEENPKRALTVSPGKRSAGATPLPARTRAVPSRRSATRPRVSPVNPWLQCAIL
jgi:hypothetical protein